MSDTKYRDQKREEIRNDLAHAQQNLIAAQEFIELHETNRRHYYVAEDEAAKMDDDALIEATKQALADRQAAYENDRPEIAVAALNGTYDGYIAAAQDRGLFPPDAEAEHEREILHTTMCGLASTMPDEKLLAMHAGCLDPTMRPVVGFVGGLQATQEQVQRVIEDEMARRGLMAKMPTAKYNA